MVFVNDGGEGYSPFHIADGHIPSGEFSTTQTGMHRRVDKSNAHLDKELKVFLTTGQGLSFAMYQHWAELSWKTPHGDYATVERLNGKLDEEVQELLEALNTSDIAEIESEIGDVAWLCMASAINGSANVGNAIKPLLYRYVMGTHYFNVPFPPWKTVAGELSITQKQLKISDVDRLIASGFEPVPFTAMNRYDDDPEMDEQGACMSLITAAAVIKALAEQQYMYGEQNYFGSGFNEIADKKLAPNCVLALLQLAYIAKNRGSTLEKCMIKNIVKLEGRLAANLIDKTDGERPAELL